MTRGFDHPTGHRTGSGFRFGQAIPPALKSLLIVSGVSAGLLAANLSFYVTLVQFGVLRHFQSKGWTLMDLGAPLGALALTGAAASLWAGFALDRREPSTTVWFTAAGVLSAVLVGLGNAVFLVETPNTAVVVFAALGLILGVQIVLLMGLFHRFVPALWRGMFAAAVAGGAYLAANLIAGFAGGPQRIGAAASGLLVAAIMGLAAGWATVRRAQPFDFGENSRILSGGAAKPWTRRDAAVAFIPMALLVVADSFTFFPLGQSDFGPHLVFANVSDWVENGVWHLLFAALAGLFYARVGARRLISAASAALIATSIALVCNTFRPAGEFVRPFYSIVVGVYTTAFVASFGEFVPRVSRYSAIGIGIVLCGWVANPIGIGLEMAVQEAFGSAGYRGVFLFSLALSVLVGAVALISDRSRPSPATEIDGALVH